MDTEILGASLSARVACDLAIVSVTGYKESELQNSRTRSLTVLSSWPGSLGARCNDGTYRSATVRAGARSAISAEFCNSLKGSASKMKAAPMDPPFAKTSDAVFSFAGGERRVAAGGSQALPKQPPYSDRSKEDSKITG